MRVLFTNDVPLIKYGLKSGFDQLGHITKIMTNEYRLWNKPKDMQLQLFKKIVDEFKPDLVFSECFVNFAEDIFLYTKQKGIPHFYWAIEDTPSDNWWGEYWSQYADVIFTTTVECIERYKKPAYLLLFACNPEFHKRVEPQLEYKCDICFVGSNYISRYEQTQKFLIPLIEKGYDIRVQGNDWWMDKERPVNLLKYPNVYHGLLAYENLPALYSSATIVLGANCNGESQTQTSMRMYEALGIGGGLLVSPYTKAQELIFGDLIYLPKTTNELFDMVNSILQMPEEERQYKAQKAQEFVYTYHTYKHRAQQIIDVYKGGH